MDEVPANIYIYKIYIHIYCICVYIHDMKLETWKLGDLMV